MKYLWILTVVGLSAPVWAAGSTPTVGPLPPTTSFSLPAIVSHPPTQHVVQTPAHPSTSTAPYINGQPNPNYNPQAYYGNQYYYGFGGGGNAGNAGEASYADLGPSPSDTAPGYALTNPAPPAPPAAETDTSSSTDEVPQAGPTFSRHQRQLVGRVVAIAADQVTVRTATGDVTLFGSPTPASLLTGDLVVAWASDDNRWTALDRVR